MTQQFTWDHTVEFVNDLKSAERTFADAGLTSQYGGKHVGHGTENSLAYFADNYLEFLALYDREEALSETPDHGLIFHEAGELLPGYVGFYRPALHVHGIEQAAERLTAKGLDLGHIVPGNRTTAAGEEIRWRLLWIKGDDRGLRYPFVIDWGASESEQLARYESGGLLHRHAIGEVDTRRAIFAVPDPAAVAAHWSDVFGLGLTEGGDADRPDEHYFDLDVGGHRVWRFVQGQCNAITELQYDAPRRQILRCDHRPGAIQKPVSTVHTQPQQRMRRVPPIQRWHTPHAVREPCQSVSQQIQLPQLVPDVLGGGLHLEGAIIVQHHRNMLLAADGHGTIGGTVLLFDVMPDIRRTQLIQRVLRLTAITTPCGAVHINGHAMSFPHAALRPRLPIASIVTAHTAISHQANTFGVNAPNTSESV